MDPLDWITGFLPLRAQLVILGLVVTGIAFVAIAIELSG